MACADTLREPRLTPFEIASGLIAGRSTTATQTAHVTCEPIAALEAAVRPAVSTGRCFVSFSGGYDSSLVLGVAARVARAEGFPLPVPITWRFANAPRAEESELQDAVVAALELPEWVRLRADDDLDLAGPVAQSILLRYGLRYPANAHLHAPMFELATGGTVLTGIGGDELFCPWPRPRRPWPLAPRAGVPGSFSWLRPAAARRAWRAIRRERRRAPRLSGQRPRWKLESRRLALGLDTARVLAEGHGADVAFPLTDAALLASIERTGLTARAVGGRAALLETLFGSFLPRACLVPRRKAIFTEVFWQRHTRAHVAAWDGTGLDEQLVDPRRLAALWRGGEFSFLTALLVQQSWLAQRASSTTGASA